MVWLAALQSMNPASPHEAAGTEKTFSSILTFSSDMFSERWKKNSISSLQKRHVWRKQFVIVCNIPNQMMQLKSNYTITMAKY